MKIRFIALLIFIVSGFSHAATTDVPHTFVAGEPINATDMNNNFSHLKQQIQNLQDAMSAIPTPTAGSGEVVFEGFSSATVLTNIGYLGMNNACKATYTGSRMCTSEEVIGDSNVTSLPAGANAWVRPLMQESGSIDKTSNIPAWSCKSWSSTQSTGLGLVVNSSLSFSNYSCNFTFLYVACCSVQ